MLCGVMLGSEGWERRVMYNVVREGRKEGGQKRERVGDRERKRERERERFGNPKIWKR